MAGVGTSGYRTLVKGKKKRVFKEEIGILSHKDIDVISIIKPAEQFYCMDHKAFNIVRIDERRNCWNS